MKELSIEEKAQRYDEAIRRAITAHKDEDRHLKAALERIFPELKENKESKGENIRKEIINYFEHYPNIIVKRERKSDYIAWLEKQGEQKETLCDKCKKAQPSHSCQDITALGRCAVEHERKPADNVKPKFKEGDWVVSNLDGKARQISEVHFDEYNSYYVVEGKSVNLEEYDRLHHLFTIEGDAEKKELKKIKQKHTPKYKVGDTIYYNSFGEVKSMIVANVVTDNTYNPMYEDENGNAVFEKDLIEQKPVWSEEDEMFVHGLIRGLSAKRDIYEHTTFGSNYIDITQTIDWLKFLKDRVQPKQ